MSRVHDLAEFSFASNFINDLPDKFETIVGQNGVLLSGGQRQSDCNSKSTAKNAPILLLDEATSALDAESEALYTEISYSPL